jgi:hypothetical protein
MSLGAEGRHAVACPLERRVRRQRVADVHAELAFVLRPALTLAIGSLGAAGGNSLGGTRSLDVMRLLCRSRNLCVLLCARTELGIAVSVCHRSLRTNLRSSVTCRTYRLYTM